jgi:lipopolysaccharide/colanic/teichoic acid biosynthesis glycosyltransferase
MASARPVLLAIDGVARRLVIDEAQAGSFVAPEKPAELAGAIRTLTGNAADRARKGAAGLAWVRAHASRSAFATRYLEVMETLPKPLHLQRGLPGLFKTLFDRVVALTALLVLAPVMLVIALLIALLDGRPVLFNQVRAGRFGGLFRIHKFRTMRERPEGLGVTRLGRLLRESSLDELPQLWNVLSGDVSLVGPRPLLPQYLPRYSERQARRHLVRPGITGWAQVNGRNALEWEEKFELDLWYVDHWSPALDLKILWRTLWQVAQRTGVRTMPEFMGTDDGGNSASRYGPER